MARSSTAVRLTVVPLLAASFLAGCGDDEETAYCVDENDEVVENRYCDDEAYAGNGGTGAFFWYYGGSAGSRGYVKGTKLSGGDKVAASNVAESARRGGFGASGRTGSSGVGRAVASSRSSSGGG